MFSIINIANASGADAVVNTIVPKIVDNIVLPILGILFSFTILVFIWGLYGFFKGDEDSRNQSKQHILWGVVGLFIMISVYGIIRLVASIVGQSSALPF